MLDKESQDEKRESRSFAVVRVADNFKFKFLQLVVNKCSAYEIQVCHHALS